MKPIFVGILAFGLLAGSPARADDSPATKNAKTATTNKQPADVAKSASSASSLEAELQQLRALVEAQARQLEEQREALREEQQKREALASELTASRAAQPAAATAPALAPSVTGTGMAAPLPFQAGTAEQKPSPLSFKIGTADFTPGGFADFASIFRTTNVGSGLGTSFASIPYNNVPQGGLTETRLTAQSSRISLKVTAKAGTADVTGYVESDFVGLQPPNANVTTNSNSLRLRLFWADVRVGKWEILGGQSWSLLTPNRTGISPLLPDIFSTLVQDPNNHVGLTWGRVPQFRVVYHPSDQWAFGISLENPQQYVGGPGEVVFPGGVPGIATLSPQVDSGFNTATPNLHPDVIVKVATDQKVGDRNFHIEAAGLLSSFKLFTPASITGTTQMTRTATAGGVTLNLNLELFSKFYLIGNTFWSDGGARYVFGLGPDFIVRQATTTSPFVPSPVHAGSGLAGFEWQARPSAMVYSYYGGGFFGRNVTTDPATGASVGFGFNGSSSSANRAVQEGTFGVIPTLWKSPNYGALQIITQYSYLTRAPWFVASGAPKNAHLSMVYLDLRYVLP